MWLDPSARTSCAERAARCAGTLRSGCAQACRRSASGYRRPLGGADQTRYGPGAGPDRRSGPRARCPTVSARIPLMLPEVHLTPGLLLAAVGRKPSPAALRAAERRTVREIDPQIRPLGLAVKHDRPDLQGAVNPSVAWNNRTSWACFTTPIIEDQKPVRQSDRPDATHPQRGGAHRRDRLDDSARGVLVPEALDCARIDGSRDLFRGHVHHIGVITRSL